MVTIWQLLKRYKRFLTPQQYKTIKGQAAAGDVAGAMRGLEKLLRRMERKSG